MTERRATNITAFESHVRREERLTLLDQRGCTIWLTGLPASGKSTTAFELERALIQRRRLAYVLDGDNIRHGLCRDLGFSMADREENIRRIGEVAKLFTDVGLITITSFISPYRIHRDQARTVHRAAGLEFFEIFIDAPLTICELRDPKGLYKRARAGELKGMTGVDDPYEPPLTPELVIKTDEIRPSEAAHMIITALETKHIIPSRR
ncbi:MAG TPA: adenylyl-sulfate kinase [Nitrospiria bacterium]|nr:adenylyl-sulfate kinase [Nitrospiria bacterium]